LYQQNLYNNSHCDNHKEKWVIKEVRKHIELLVSDLPAIYVIEHLHKDEGIEDKGVMESCLRRPKLIWSSEFNVEDPASSKEKNRENNYLEETLA
jgi:hypothetical protein